MISFRFQTQVDYIIVAMHGVEMQGKLTVKVLNLLSHGGDSLMDLRTFNPLMAISKIWSSESILSLDLLP